MTSKNKVEINHAVVAGAGMAGLLAAAALSDHVGKVTIIEKDLLPESPQFRNGVAQGAHVHTLLGFGVKAMDELIPGLMSDLYTAGAVKIRRNYDLWFHDAIGPTPIRDVGLLTPSVTRPLLEHITRKRVLSLPNVNLRDNTKLLDTELDKERRIAGVKIISDDVTEILPTDLVIEGSGRASNLTKWLPEHGYGEVPLQRIKIMMGYTSGFFRLPKEVANEAKACLMLAIPPANRAAYLTPVDGDIWLATMYGRGHDTAPRELKGFLEWAEGLPHPVIHELLSQAESISEFKTYKIPFGTWYRYDQMNEFPDGLIPMGEALTSFNPMYGQGMSLAAGQALALRDVVSSNSQERLAARYFKLCHTLNSVGWSVMETRDYAHDITIGERPSDLESRWQAASALRQLAETDAEVHKLSVQVTHLLKSPKELSKPEILEKIKKLS